MAAGVARLPRQCDYRKRFTNGLWVLNRELEDDVLVGKRPVHLGEGVKLRLDVDLVLGVEEHLQHFRSIELVSNPLANDLRGVDNVFKYGILDSSECS